MRYVVAVVVMVGLTAATFLLPPPAAPQFGAEPGTETPPVSICPVVEVGGRATNIAILSSISGTGRVSTFSAGEESGTLDFETSDTGSIVVPASDAGAIGVSGALVELPSATTASGVLISGEDSRAAEACADIPTGQAFVSGGSTASGASFEVQLLNPYAGEAVLELIVTSDAGIESDERFEAVIVPPLSTLPLDLTEIIPGREDIAVNIETLRGSVLAVGRQTRDSETAVWRAVEPGLDWWLPVPEGRGRKQLLLATPSNAPIEYQVDVYGLSGEVESYQEAFETGTLDARSQTRVGLGAISGEAFGVHVTSTGPLVATLWIDSNVGMAATTAGPTDAPVWLLPGAFAPPDGSGSLVVLNSSVDDVNLSVQPIQVNAPESTFELPAEQVLTVPLAMAEGYRVEASGPVIALWTSELGGAGTAALGIPIQDG